MKKRLQHYRVLLQAAFVFCLGITYADAAPSDYMIKAAQTALFINDIEWSALSSKGDSNQIDLCILGDASIEKASDFFAKFNEKNKSNPKARIINLIKDRSLSELTSCQVVFIGQSKSADLSAIFGTLRNTAVLTISEIPDFVENGGMIGFVPIETAEGVLIKFAINTKALRSAHLSIGADVLSLAYKVVN